MSREKLANRISDVFNPYYSSAPFFLLVALGATESALDAALNWLVLAFFFSFLPMWDIKRRIRRGLVADPHISRREDRIKPFLFSLGFAVAGLAMVYALGSPPAIKAVAWVVVVNGALITAITAAWKVSLHAAGVTSIAVVLIALYGAPALVTLLFVPVVFWARLVLEKHTPAQLIAGSLLAAAVALAVFRLFGLI